MARYKKLRQVVQSHSYVLKKKKKSTSDVEMINYVVSTVYNGIMYINITINGKWPIFLYLSSVFLKMMYVCACV